MDSVKATVPAYEFWEVTVTVEVPELPCVTVTLVAERVKLPLEEVPLDPPTFTVRDPLEGAKVESPE